MEAIFGTVIEQHPPPPPAVLTVLFAVAAGVYGTGVVLALLKLHHNTLTESGSEEKHRGGRRRERVTEFKVCKTEKSMLQKQKIEYERRKGAQAFIDLKVTALPAVAIGGSSGKRCTCCICGQLYLTSTGNKYTNSTE